MSSKKRYQHGLLWFRRDLRLADQAALQLALSSCQQLSALFIFDRCILDGLRDRDDRRVSFIYQSLLELRKQLQSWDSDLYVFHGDPAEIVPLLARELIVQAVFVNRDYESYAQQRDHQVRHRLTQSGIDFQSSKDQVIFEAADARKDDGTAYRIYTPYSKTCLQKLAENPQHWLPHHQYDVQELSKCLSPRAQIQRYTQHLTEKYNWLPVRELKEIGFAEATDLAVPAGERAANQQLCKFAQKKLYCYKQQRNFPELEGTSDLAVALRFGTISVRECFRQAYKHLEGAVVMDQPIRESIEIWIKELLWREFYMMILQSFPYVESESFQPQYREMTWSNNHALFESWQEGETGYPIVDAAMKQLKQSGQMHNRLRMIVGSFLVKDLLCNWQWGETHFARYLLDFELSSNNGNWQWVASTGTDAAPYFRIFNPRLQSQKFDPEAHYIKRFLPQLADVPASKIHRGSFTVPGYPQPIIDHQQAKEIFKKRFSQAKALE